MLKRSRSLGCQRHLPITAVGGQASFLLVSRFACDISERSSGGDATPAATASRSARCHRRSHTKISTTAGPSRVVLPCVQVELLRIIPTGCSLFPLRDVEVDASFANGYRYCRAFPPCGKAEAQRTPSRARRRARRQAVKETVVANCQLTVRGPRAIRNVARIPVALLAFCLIAVLPGSAMAEDALPWFHTYNVPGGYAVGGVDIVPLSFRDGLRTRRIAMGNQLPANAEILAAFLYWETMWSGPDAELNRLRGQVKFRGFPVSAIKSSTRATHPGLPRHRRWRPNLDHESRRPPVCFHSSWTRTESRPDGVWSTTPTWRRTNWIRTR